MGNLAALVASSHYLALGIGLGSVFMRGRYLRSLKTNASDTETLNRVFAADNFWGAAAALWLLTGALRVFGGFDKGAGFYVTSHWFWLKMTLFGIIFLLELFPMFTLLQWRMLRKRPVFSPQASRIPTLILINNIELVLVLIIPPVASIMARTA